MVVDCAYPTLCSEMESVMHYQEFAFSTAASYLKLTEDHRLIDEGNH